MPPNFMIMNREEILSQSLCTGLPITMMGWYSTLKRFCPKLVSVKSKIPEMGVC